jgi:hypothetical protein
MHAHRYTQAHRHTETHRDIHIDMDTHTHTHTHRHTHRGKESLIIKCSICYGLNCKCPLVAQVLGSWLLADGL